MYPEVLAQGWPFGSATGAPRSSYIGPVSSSFKVLDLPADSLELEITEGVLLEQVDDTTSKLRNLQALGIKISVDDFGTGYSSLRYLKNLPVDKIKIDRSFVKEIASDRNDAAISKVIISLAHHLNLKVVAEGVETAAQYWFLKRNFCDEFQGYLFARAMPVGQLAERLQRNGGVETLPTRQEDVDEERNKAGLCMCRPGAVKCNVSRWKCSGASVLLTLHNIHYANYGIRKNKVFIRNKPIRLVAAIVEGALCRRPAIGRSRYATGQTIPSPNRASLGLHGSTPIGRLACLQATRSDVIAPDDATL